MSQRTVSLTLLSAVFLVVGDAILQIIAVGTPPATGAQWYALAQPEIVNALVFIIVMLCASMMSKQSSSVLWGVLAAAVISTGIHRWIAGSQFRAVTIGFHLVLFFLLGWISLWLAGMVIKKQA